MRRVKLPKIFAIPLFVILSLLNVANIQAEAFEQPKGIYILDGSEGDNRDTRIRDYPFVTGYVWRMSWVDFETSQGVYDFSKIDDIISQLEPIHQKLSIILGANRSQEPAYITSTPGVQTWVDPDTGNTRPIPWNSYLQERFAAFTQALGNHLLPNAANGGALTPLRDHPVLANINFGIAGMGEIRERGFEISSLAGYSRTNFVNAVKSNLHAQTDQFPNKFVYVGFWKVTDSTSSPTLWEYTQSSVLSEFNGTSNPRVGFWMENLAASKDLGTGVVTGYPSTTYAEPLYLSKDSTFIMFQALQGWDAPFSNPDKTANAVPNDGIQYGYDTFNCDYYELYLPDIEDQNYWPSFQSWHNLFFADTTPPSLSAVTPVPNPTNNTTPDFTFSSDEAGTITYSGDCSSSTTSAGAGSNTITFNTLSSGTHSNCTITVTDAANNPSSPLAVASFTIDTTPPVISSVSSSHTTNSATITWTTNEGADSQIEYGEAQSYGSQTTLDSNKVTSHSQELTDLIPSTLYHFRVKSRDAADNLAASNDYTFTTQATPDIDSPSVPGNLSASAVSYSQINISWDASSDNIGVAGYRLYRDGTLLTTTSDTFFSDTTISPSTTYFYTITAYDAANNESSQTTPVFVDTPPRTYNNADFENLVQDWLQAKSSPTDINGDGIINSRDVGIMMSNWQN